MAKKPKHKPKQYSNKFNEDFKNGPHQENKKNKKQTLEPITRSEVNQKEKTYHS